MKQLSKTQTKIIILLNVVIVVLLCGLFFMNALGESPSSGEPIDEPHDIYRAARISLNVDLDFETNIGGSLDENLVATFASPDQTKLHIFGNSESSDFDFTDGGGIFFLVTDRKAKIERLTKLGVEGDVLKKVTFTEGGYLLAIDNSLSKTTYLISVAYDGTILKTIRHNSASEETVVDLILMENCHMLIVRSGISSINFYDIKVFFYDFSLNESGASVLNNASYSQEYLYVLPKGLDKYVMAVNLKSDLWNGLAIIEFSKGANNFTKIELENNYSAVGFMPVIGGYAVLIIDVSGRSSMLIINSSDYAVKEKKYLATSATDAKLFFANSNYYAFIKTAEKSLMLRFNMSMSSYEDISAFRDTDTVYASYAKNQSVLFACGGDNASVISLSSSQGFSKSFGSSSSETNVQLVFLGSDLFLICETSGSDKDVGANFGKKDIWITKVSV